MYKNVVRPLLFKIDPEKVHHLALGAGRILNIGFIRSLCSSLFKCTHPILETEVCGLTFPNPVGLAAGFDKDAKAVGLFSSLGFGSLELGTVTSCSQDGNQKPRIHRFVREKALVNSLGFPSEGIDSFASRLPLARSIAGNRVVGVNIGKAKKTPLEHAVADYVGLFSKVQDFCDYVALNVSSPNTPELRTLQSRENLGKLLSAVTEANARNIPIFLKLAPDLTTEELDEVVEVVKTHKVSGIIATNTTLDRTQVPGSEELAGGVSGAPLFDRAVEVVSYLYKKTEGSIPLIGVGGVFTGADALKMIQSGASLVQAYTGVVYEGPLFVKRINSFLLDYCTENNIDSISSLVGSRWKQQRGQDID